MKFSHFFLTGANGMCDCLTHNLSNKVKKPMPDLNKNELEALRILWEKGSLKPAQIQEFFSWDMDNGTLRSVLRVLMQKGHVERRKKGKAFFYRARGSRHGVLSSMIRSLAGVFSGGSTVGLITELIKSEKLKKEEIEELERIASSEMTDGRGMNREVRS